ncbi:unnamed protein product, partial [Anisakis simplex]|uniref:Phosphofurin acidic cluster sorting protein 2 n=1 Tax=Anisakis simplex TaxID=6269 RepID=A0A0M3KHW0_ANISI
MVLSSMLLRHLSRSAFRKQTEIFERPHDRAHRSQGAAAASINFYENRRRGYHPLSTRSFSQSHCETRIPSPDGPEDQRQALPSMGTDQDRHLSDPHDVVANKDTNNNNDSNLSSPSSSSQSSSIQLTECRVVLVGDYKSGVSTLRSEFIRMNDSRSPKAESDFEV